MCSHVLHSKCSCSLREGKGGQRHLTHSQLRQSAAQLLRYVVELFQLGLLLPSVLTYYFLLQPLIGLEGDRRGDSE